MLGLSFGAGARAIRKSPTIRMASSLFAAMVLSVPSPAMAWGDEGHAIIAYIAASELTPHAAAEVQALLGPDYSAEHNMVHFASWADRIRYERPKTAPWHYVDIELESAGYDANRDCPNQNCVIAQIEQEERIIANTSLPLQERAEALKFLIHFVGDIHQPLHAADHHDRGGNEVHLLLDGNDTNLHRIWDTNEVEQLGGDPAAVATRFAVSITVTEQKAWSAGTPEQWASESFEIARSRIYRHLASVNGDGERSLTSLELQSNRLTVENQLKKAGVRLAQILNKILR